MGRVTTHTRITRLEAQRRSVRSDTVVVEEPLELRLNGTALSVTMRTPGSDIELAQGFPLTEGIITDRDAITAIRYCNSTDENGRNTYNVLDIDLTPGVDLPETGLERNFYTTSSCGVYGKASLDAIRQRTRHSPAHDPVVVDPGVLVTMPDTLRHAQTTFDRAGGLHAAGLFTTDGDLLDLREDIGRHNAVDKIIGWAVENRRLTLRRTVLVVGGRASFELTRKPSWSASPSWPPSPPPPPGPSTSPTTPDRPSSVSSAGTP